MINRKRRIVLIALAFAFLALTCGELLNAQTDAFQPEIAREIVREFLAARELRKQGQLEEAQAGLENVLKKQPDYYRALYNLALVHVERREYREAVGILQKALAVQKDRDIDDPKIYSSMGWLYMQLKLPEESEKYLKLAENHLDGMDPDVREGVLNNLGTLYLNRKQYDQADKYFKQAQSRFDSRVAAMNMAVLDRVRDPEPTYVSNAWFIILGSFQQARGLENPRKLEKRLAHLTLDVKILDSNRFSNFTDGLWVVAMGPYRLQRDALNDLKSVKVMTGISDAYCKNGGNAVPLE